MVRFDERSSSKFIGENSGRVLPNFYDFVAKVCVPNTTKPQEKYSFSIVLFLKLFFTSSEDLWP